MREKGSHGGGWMYNQAGQTGKTEILAKQEPGVQNGNPGSGVPNGVTLQPTTNDSGAVHSSGVIEGRCQDAGRSD